MVTIVYFLVATTLAVLNAFSGAFQASTLYWGRRLAGLPTKESVEDPIQKSTLSGESLGNPGLQGGLTTRSHKVRQNISILLVIIILVSGFIFFKWYIPLITLLGTLIISYIMRVQLPKANSEYFKQKIIKELVSQSKFYNNRGAKIKKEATDYFINKMMAN
jgi:hypothetical protein